MNRETLASKLSFMQEFTVIKEEFYKLVGAKKRKPANYYAGSDKRFSNGIDYLKGQPSDDDVFISNLAFYIAANLSLTCMERPSCSQLSIMLNMVGYTQDEMNEYVQNRGFEPEIIPSYPLRAPAYLLARVLEDALSDCSEWSGKKRKSKNQSLERLQVLATYMISEGLLDLDPEAVEEYESFILHHAEYHLKRTCMHFETSAALEITQRQIASVRDESNNNIKRLLLDAANPPAPLMRATETPSLGAVLDGIGAMNYRFSQRPQKVVRPSAGQALPPAMQKEIEKANRRCDSLSSAFNSLLESTDDIQDALAEEKKKLIREEDMAAVAEGAFQAILTGDDEIFKIEISFLLVQDFVAQSPMPIPIAIYKDLPDEEEWNYIDTGENGDLGLKVYGPDDLVVLKDDDMEEEIPVPLSNVLANFSDITVDTQLYIRKSHIEYFKKAGFSDQRARDFAVILGTLESRELLEEDFSPEKRLYDTGDVFPAYNAIISRAAEEKAPETHPEPETDTSAEKIEQLERSLKQAKKENKSCRHEISMLQREVEELKGRLEEGKKPETDPKQPPEEAPAPKEDVSFPYRTDLKIVVYGGFEVFHRALLEMMPDIRIIPAASHIDLNPIRNADMVFLQINKTDHSGYWTVCDACKAANVPYLHLNYASAKRCAGVIAEEIRKLGG